MMQSNQSLLPFRFAMVCGVDCKYWGDLMYVLMSTVSSIMRSLRANAEREMADYGLGHPEQMVLMCLYPDKTFNQDSIARMLDVDKGAVARTMVKLEEKGLILRVQNPDNRRENLVSLAPGSKEVMGKMNASLKACADLAFQGFSKDEREQLLDNLLRISENLR